MLMKTKNKSSWILIKVWVLQLIKTNHNNNKLCKNNKSNTKYSVQNQEELSFTII